MVKPEWGTKRSCPKCGTRFYDLGKEDPVTCIQCGVAWDPEPVLKSKQPLPYDAPKKEAAVDDKEDADLAADELAIDEDVEHIAAGREVASRASDDAAADNPYHALFRGGDDDVGVPGAGDDEEEI